MEEGSEDEEISAHACQELGMAGYFLTLQVDKQSAYATLCKSTKVECWDGWLKVA